MIHHVFYLGSTVEVPLAVPIVLAGCRPAFRLPAKTEIRIEHHPAPSAVLFRDDRVGIIFGLVSPVIDNEYSIPPSPRHCLSEDQLVLGPHFHIHAPFPFVTALGIICRSTACMVIPAVVMPDFAEDINSLFVIEEAVAV